MTEPLGYQEVLRWLVALLEKTMGDSLTGPIEYVGPGSVRQLGLTSVKLLEVLIEIDNEFGVVWDDDVDEAVIASIDEMARHITEVARWRKFSRSS